MIGLLRRRWLPVGIALGLWICVAVSVSACPFCSMQGKTLTGEVQDAAMVLYGSLKNARLAAGGTGEGTTDLQIDAVIKKHEILGNNKQITLDRYVPEDKNYKYLVFCDVFKGKVDPYRGVAVKADSAIDKYLTGALAVKDKDLGQRLRFFFDYLDNEDSEISNDAYKEFGNADYKDVREMYKNLPRQKLIQWLSDPKTPAFRHALYASMLGHCGKEEDAALLRKMLDDPEQRASSGVDGLMAGYIMLQPKAAWEYLQGILKDPAKEFTLRYAGLRTIRFFYDNRPDILPKKQLVQGTAALLDQSDIADLAIEDLRKWHDWSLADRILGLYGKKSHDIPIIRRSILRYALGYLGDAKNPKDSAAAKFVADLRMKDPQMVKDAEELLKLETTAPAADVPK
jgi:hypothetical protein